MSEVMATQSKVTTALLSGSQDLFIYTVEATSKRNIIGTSSPKGKSKMLAVTQA